MWCYSVVLNCKATSPVLYHYFCFHLPSTLQWFPIFINDPHHSILHLQRNPQIRPWLYPMICRKLQMCSFMRRKKGSHHVGECKRRRSLCFFLSWLSHCIIIAVVVSKTVSKKLGKIDIKCLFHWRLSIHQLLVCVCFSEQCLENVWVVERIHNAAL